MPPPTPARTPSTDRDRCLGCGRSSSERPFVDRLAPHEQVSAFGYCPGCAAPGFKTRSHKRKLAEELVRRADLGEATLLTLASEVSGHVAEQTVRRRARAVGVGVNPPAWGEFKGGGHRWFIAAGRLLLAFASDLRTWDELVAWAHEQGWTPEDVRELVGRLAQTGDVTFVRETCQRLPPWDEKTLGPDTRSGHPKWWVVASPSEADDEGDEADATPAWAASLGPSALASAGHAPRGGRPCRP